MLKRTLRCMAVTTVVPVELYADLVCPWCWIGDRRLLRAVTRVQEAHPSVRFDLSWRPFQLDPTLPAAGRDWGEVIENKFGGRTRAEPMFEHVASAGEADGCVFNFDRMTRYSNTARAHGLVLETAQRGLDPWPFVEALYTAHFTNGADLGDSIVLTPLAKSAGLNDEQIAQVLDHGRHDIAVRESQRDAARLGIQGVPFVVLDNKYGVSGAQPEAVFVEALSRAASITLADNASTSSNG